MKPLEIVESLKDDMAKAMVEMLKIKAISPESGGKGSSKEQSSFRNGFRVLDLMRSGDTMLEILGLRVA
ncbi:MAG TPA: hypothetical protein EYP23_02410 [Thermoplasmata archaeon]|nr:hypothetical protein [Thermoplasmata archaeon]